MGPADVDVAAVRRQLEYYFSDSNLPRDKFLRAKTEENEAGYVNIDVLLTFKRLQNLGASEAIIAEAVTDSTLLGLDDEKKRIRRVIALPETPEFSNRAVFAKGWVAGSEEPSLDVIHDMFSPSGKVLAVRIRRWTDEQGKRHFKGSIFVEMENAEAAERACAEEYSIEIKGEDGGVVKKPLLLLPFDTYVEKKKEETRERTARFREKIAKRKEAKFSKAAANGEQAAAKTENDTANGEDGAVAKSEPGADKDRENNDVPLEASGEADTTTGKRKREEKPEEKTREIVPGLILRLEGFGPDVSREDIKEAFEPHGEVAWVDFQRGDTDGYLRFARPGAAEVAATAMREAKVEFGGQVPSLSVLEGEVEQAYWKQMWEKRDQMVENSKKRRRENNRGGFRGRRGGGRGGFRGRGGRGRGRGGGDRR